MSRRGRRRLPVAKRLRYLPLAFILASALGIAACGGGDEDGGGGGDLQEVTYRTGFVFAPWDAGPAVALDKGYYEDVGLDVSIEQGQGSATNVQLSANNRATFTHTAGNVIATAVAKGAPVKAVASFFQTDGSGIMADPSITTPEEMVGKTLAGTPTSFTTLLVPAYEEAVGLEPGSIKVQSIDPAAQPTVFEQGRTDMMTALGWAEVPQVKADGVEFNFFPFSEVGVNIVGPSLLVNEETLESDPEMVKDFVEATAKGYAWTYDHPDEAAQIVGDMWPTTQEKYNQAVTPLLADFAHTPRTKDDNLGWMAKEDWQQTVDILAESGELEEPVEASELFTNVIPQSGN